MDFLSFDQFLQEQLNTPQKNAVTKKDGNLLVIAGAGSGKTRVITARIAHLIVNGMVDPSSIVALTFTNKAALEMKSRLRRWLRGTEMTPYVGTFHSYCLFLLRSYKNFLDIPQFSIIDADDQMSIMRGIIKKNNLQKYGKPAQWLYQISRTKSKLSTSNMRYEYSTPMFKEVYKAYEQEKAAACCFDFDDLLIKVLELFTTNPDFKELYQASINHILVDEYQDTSDVQHELLRQMALDSQGCCAVDSVSAVGDEDQSIYSWRGASVANMLQFAKDFHPVETIMIEQNYRSAQSILDTANHLIQHNVKRSPKALWSEKKNPHRVLLGRCYSEEQEAQALLAFLNVYKKNHSLQSCAVLYRTHAQSRVLEEALIRASIPYKIVGGLRFYERKEIKDLLAYLKLLVNPFDRVSLMRIINCPNRGLGQKFEELLTMVWEQNPLYDFRQILRLLLADDQYGIKGIKARGIEQFLNLFDGFDETCRASEVIVPLLEKTEYVSFLKASYDEKEANSRIENVKEFVQSILNHEENGSERVTSSDTSLASFLYEVALLQEKIDDTQEHEQLQLMSLHAAKGLEFHAVIITGLEEGVLPSSRSLETDEALEEERRLLYVGITRAEEYLLVLYALRRHQYGQFFDQEPSRFIAEMPDEHIQKISLERLYSAEMTQHFSAWLQDAPLPTISDFSPSQRIPQSRMIKKGAFNKGPQRKCFTKENISPGSGWKKHQTVYHKVFGAGVVVGVEPASENDYYITALFKVGKKRILSSYLSKSLS